MYFKGSLGKVGDGLENGCCQICSRRRLKQDGLENSWRRSWRTLKLALKKDEGDLEHGCC